MLDANEVPIRLCVRHPLALVVFHERHIDPNAGTSLAEWCAGRGTDARAALDAVVRAERATEVPWRDVELSTLIDHLLRSHQLFRKELAIADELVDAARTSRRELHRLFDELQADMTLHMESEERVLYPLLRSQPTSATGPIRAMEREHADVIALMHRLHETTSRSLGHVRDDTARETVKWLARVENTLCEHMHLEQHVLYAGALALRT